MGETPVRGLRRANPDRRRARDRFPDAKGRETKNVRRIRKGSVEPYSGKAGVRSPARLGRNGAAEMLDHPEKTAQLLAALKAAVPFTVTLAPEVVASLSAENVRALPIERTVADLSYAGDEGGIVCHLAPVDEGGAIFISLTHVRAPRLMPLSQAILSYQKHRVKKLKKQGNA